VRFHAVFWPAFLMAADLPLPKRIFAHGWLLFENDKMSKSRGNIVRATPIHKVLGTDALRYFLLREVVFGQDGSFSYDALVGRYNSDLANGLGNLASRTLSMIHQYRGGAIPKSAGDSHIAEDASMSNLGRARRVREIRVFKALEMIWSLIAAVDKYIVEQAPWKQAKAEGGDKHLDQTLYTAAEALRIITCLLGSRASRIHSENLVAAGIHQPDHRSPHQGSPLGPPSRRPSSGNRQRCFPEPIPKSRSRK
jgi:methionyl-tRNA synthetase